MSDFEFFSTVNKICNKYYQLGKVFNEIYEYGKVTTKHREIKSSPFVNHLNELIKYFSVDFPALINTSLENDDTYNAKVGIDCKIDNLKKSVSKSVSAVMNKEGNCDNIDLDLDFKRNQLDPCDLRERIDFCISAAKRYDSFYNALINENKKDVSLFLQPMKMNKVENKYEFEMKIKKELFEFYPLFYLTTNEKDFIDCEKCNQKGKLYFKCKNYPAFSAVRYFLKSIELNKSEIKYVNNSALCYLKMRNFKRALIIISDYELIHKKENGIIEKKNIKFMKKFYIFKIKSSIGMNKFKESIELVTLHSEIIGSKITKLFLERIALGKNQQSGYFDLFKLYNSKSNEPIDIVSDYISNAIEKIPVKNKGFGYVAKRDIQEGELLMVCKAMISIFDSKEMQKVYLNFGENQYISIRNNLTMNSPGRIGLIVKTIHYLSVNPEMQNIFKELWDRENSDNNRIDIERIIQKLTSTSFSFTNSFGFLNNVQRGVFYHPSFLNHDCISNTMHTFSNDVMVVCATRNIKKGDEICISYKNVYSMIPNEVNSSLKEDYGFNCKCPFCNNSKSAWKRFYIKKFNESVIIDRINRKGDIEEVFNILKESLNVNHFSLPPRKKKKKIAKSNTHNNNIISTKYDNVHPQLVRWALAYLVLKERFGIDDNNEQLQIIYPYLDKYEPWEVCAKLRFNKFLGV